MIRLSALAFVIILLLSSCEDQLGNPADVPGNLINSSLNLFDGEVIEKRGAKVDEVEVWKVRIQKETGAITTFYWRKTFNNIYRIVGEKGPFDYEIRPPMDVINYSTARFLAFNQKSNDDMVSWKFLRSIDENRWFYQFYLLNVTLPITIDAGSGTRVR